MATIGENVGKRSWTELVEAGKQALAQESHAQFTLGDLVLELEPIKVGGGAPGKRGAVQRGVYDRVDKYAKALGVKYYRLLNLRTIAHAWPPETRTAGVCFSVFERLTPEPARVQILDRLVKQAAKQKRTVSVDDVAAARGRRGPGRPRLTLVQNGQPRSATERRQFLESLTVDQIAALIDEAWKVLEERSRKAA